MKKYLLLLFLTLFSVAISAQDSVVSPDSGTGAVKVTFDSCFVTKTLRIDYLLSGNDTSTIVMLYRMKEEPHWGGPHDNLIDPWNSGNFRFSVFDSATGVLLYRKGFSSLFEEWQGTEEAKRLHRAYSMTAVFPFPQHAIKFGLDKRDKTSSRFINLVTLDIRPDDYFISRDPVDSLSVDTIFFYGNPQDHLDIVFLAEGYTNDEMPKFREDAKRFAEYFRSVVPFNEMQDKINFRAVESPSRGSGVDIPGRQVYVNTNINSSFYTFDSERYLTTSDTWSIYDIAANAPYDQIIVLNNSPKYGGGGFYNHYCQSTVDNPTSFIVAIHEFGHSFGGLADEYVGGVNYDGFYNLSLEPWEPNITTNVDFSSKWGMMIADTIPVPTPRIDAYVNIVGMFEGGGYMAKGIFSPMMNCRMNSNDADGFCPVCREALRKKIRFYSDEGTGF
jgi:hypothetical protein